VQTDTYQQRRLEAALLRHGTGTSWRQYLLQQRRSRRRSTEVMAELFEIGVSVDPRTILRWTRQALQEEAHKLRPEAGTTARRT
jgi:hypothetical protein